MEAKYAQYKSYIYESAFPFLVDFFEEAPVEYLRATDSGEQIEIPERIYLSEAEYSKKTEEQRADLALQRYIERRKTNWEIGRDYERYIGYRYEIKGWEVEFHGAVKGFEDAGRDLIVTKNRQARIIQCKYWSQWKEVRENTIYQLFGTMIEYALENNDLKGESSFQELIDHGDVRGVLVTSTEISDKAARACKSLGIHVRANFTLDKNYPRVKCNVSVGDKVYHLPFDQQYDRIKIKPGLGETYAFTASEAKKLGFRRAHRWRGGSQN